MKASVKWWVFIAIIGGILGAPPPPKDAPPRFEDFPVTAVYRGPVKPPLFGDPQQFQGTDARCFADPGFYGGERANFAGHFVISTCTCGTGCHYLFMWDAITGKFYQRLPPGVIDIGSFDGGGGQSLQYKGEQYRINSSLLIVEGCIEDTCDCSKRYYRWTGSQFKLLLRQPVPMPDACLKKPKSAPSRDGEAKSI